VSQEVSSFAASSSSTLNSTALTILQQFEDKVKRELSELSSLDEGLSEERYRVSYPPLEREQRYIM
jgi:hypothetical protein